MPMNILERARHLNSSASTPIRKVITPSRITIALFTLVMSLNDIIGLLRRWTMDYASRLLSKMSNPVGFSVGQNSSARASSFSTTAASFVTSFFATFNGPDDARDDQRPERGSEPVTLPKLGCGDL